MIRLKRRFRILGGCTALAMAAALLLAAPASAVFNITSFDALALQTNGEPATQAGSHPAIGQTSFLLNKIVTPGGVNATTETMKDVTAKLPPGVLSNAEAVKTCSVADFLLGTLTDERLCPPESQVGLVEVGRLQYESQYGTPDILSIPLYSLRAPQGTAALFGFALIGRFPVFASAELRTDGDYGATVTTRGISQFFDLEGATFTVWGVPADPSHDTQRDQCIHITQGKPVLGCSVPSPEVNDPKAFFTLPTSCTGPARTEITVTSWEGGEDSAEVFSHDNGEPPALIGNTGCGALEFEPTLKARPTTNVADAPTGLEVDLHIPQETIADPTGTVTAHLRDTTVTLPEGLTLNASGANGLDGCSSAQAGLLTPIGAKPIHFSKEPTGCPDAAKVGAVEIETPLVDHPINGVVYVAKSYDNPFNSLLAIYITINDPPTGEAATLAGEVHADPQTGQLTSTVQDNPQVPLEDISLRFFAGARAPLRTPSTCGTYSVTSQLTPWSAPESGPPATPSDSWQISQGPGRACATSAAALPHSPAFDAGTLEPLAGHHSPFVLNLRREDGTQRFAAIDLDTPQGLLAKLTGTTRCSEAALAAAAAKTGRAEKTSPSCPASSRIGSVVAGAGVGPAPYYASGDAYLAGPYKGAPLSLAIVTPATAGPFDLGTIVVRTALYVNPVTAQISAVSDPVPHILQGIPLDVRSVQVKLDRPEFMLNPTSCDPSAVKGSILSTLGQTASLQSRFQLAECSRLRFKPRMTMRLRGGTKRGDHPALTVTLRPRAGDANIASVSVALPRSEFLDQGHIGTVCTRVQWAADACPAASVYGKVSVTTPLLAEPLTGKVYLRSSDNVLPDLVPDLRGPADLPIRFEAAGRTDSIRGGIRNTFDFVPDAPFTKLVVQLEGAKKGLLVNSRDICARTWRATVKYGAHNGLRLTDRPPLQAKCAAKAGKKKHRAQGRAAR